MDGNRFDAFTRAFAGHSSRRRLVGTLLTGSTAALWLRGGGAQPCLATAAPLPDLCESTLATCCSGYCDTGRNICCTPLAQACTTDAECCGHDPTTPVGGTQYGCDVATFTCILGVKLGALDQPPPPPDTPTPLPNTPMDLASVTSEISRIRTVAYGIVGIIKQNYAPTNATYLQAQNSFLGVRANFDGWISGLTVDLTQGTDATQAITRFESQFQTALTSASSFVEEFGAVTAVTGGGPQNPVQAPTDPNSVTGGGLVEVVALAVQLLPVVVPIVTDLVNGWRTMGKEQRDVVIVQFESLRWQPWADVTG